MGYFDFEAQEEFETKKREVDENFERLKQMKPLDVFNDEFFQSQLKEQLEMSEQDHWHYSPEDNEDICTTTFDIDVAQDGVLSLLRKIFGNNPF